MQAFIRLFSAMTRIERIVLGVFSVLLLASLIGLLRMFYIQNTQRVPVTGGTYIEGSVGELLPLNPWFAISNDVNHDIVSLIFSGLLKYNPITQHIEPDLATLDISKDGRIYTLTLKEHLFWHDSTSKNPHPVTADDVLFTFKTIQDPEFPNTILKQNYRGVEINKVSDRTVTFTLEKPYAFFPSNLTLGLLPKQSFENVPIKKLNQATDFGLHPIGSGPYAFVNIIQTDLSTEVTLRRFERPSMPTYKVDRIVMRIFPEYSSLITDSINIDGVRLVPRNEKGKPVLPKGFKLFSYTLPQYTALFFNLDRGILSDRTLRLGLQLATNKQEIVDALHEVHIIDTPLAEIDLGSWQYKFDPKAAQGALFNSNWNMPEKVRLQRLLERRDANNTGPLRGLDPVALLQTGAVLTLTGSLKDTSWPIAVNGIAAQTGSWLDTNASGSGTWFVKLRTTGTGTDALRIGTNVIRMTNEKGVVIDSFTIDRYVSPEPFQLARAEQQLVNEFVSSRALAPSKRMTVDDIYLERGFLRRKKAEDIPHTRINAKGKELTLTLLTSSSPPSYRKVAQMVQAQWRQIGVDLRIDIPATHKEFEERTMRRDYDILLFGQSLLDNLDSYPYWHSSQIQEKDKKNLKLDAFNVSQYASFDADALLQKIRGISDEKSRSQDLAKLNEIIKRDIPAVFLYSPLYFSAYDEGIQGVQIGKLSLHADRFASLKDWFITTERQFTEGKGWLSFPGWMMSFF